MKLKWYGHSCFSMTFSDGTVLVTDPFDESVGYPLCTVRADAALVSHGHFDHNYVRSLQGDPAVFDAPGAYTAGNVSVTGISSFHDPEQGSLRGKNVIFVVQGDGLRIAHLGDLGHMPDETQLHALENLDLLLIPIGGFYTIDTTQACGLIRRIRPRTAVAMHFSNDYCRFNISDEKDFIALTGASAADNEIEILPGSTLPDALVMQLPR